MVLCCCGSRNEQVDDPEDGAGGPKGAEARGPFISRSFCKDRENIYFFSLQRGAPGILLTKCSPAGLEEWKNLNMEVRIFILFSIYSLDVCHNLPCC